MKSETDEPMPEVALAVLCETRAHQFMTEASSAGFPPGIWPRSFRVTPSIGNGNEFVPFARNQDVRTYKQLLGVVTVHILND